MEFEIAAAAATRLGVTTRAVQKWAKEGKIPGAFKQGRDWLIPITATRPGERQAIDKPSPLKYLLPLTAASFDVTDSQSFIDSIDDPVARSIALAERHYYAGRAEACIDLIRPCLQSDNDAVLFSAALLASFSALALGDSALAAEVVEKTFARMHVIMSESDDIHLQAVAVLTAKIISTQLQLRTEQMPLLRRYMRYLPAGLKLFSAYALAYESFLENNFDRALGILDSASACADTDYPIPLLNVYILSSVCHMHLKQPDKAVDFITRAWKIAKYDDLIAPFAEHYGLLQGVVEATFKRSYPDTFAEIYSLAHTYSAGWYKLYNQKSHREVVTTLRGVEKPIAILYSRGWRIKEIAAFLELSESTIKKHVQVIYEKLHINGKKALSEHLFL